MWIESKIIQIESLHTHGSSSSSRESSNKVVVVEEGSKEVKGKEVKGKGK